MSAPPDPEPAPPEHESSIIPEAEPTIIQVALKGLCPRCGEPTLFAGLLAFADRCAHCGLDIAGFNVGDGPAAFLTLIIGTIVVALVVWVQVAFAPPWWVHVLIWPAVTLALVVGSLRLAKGALIAAEYRNGAREERW